MRRRTVAPDSSTKYAFRQGGQAALPHTSSEGTPMRPTLQAGLTVAIALFLAAMTREDASPRSVPAAETPGLAGLADDWPVYGHDPGGIRYSPLTEINRQNVSQL